MFYLYGNCIMGDPQFGDDYEYENGCGNIHICS